MVPRIVSILQEAASLPRLVSCEFRKLKRRKFIRFTILAAVLFPVPLTVFAVKGALSFDWLAMNSGVFGSFLLLPTVLGILGAILFFSERNNATEKNLLTIPVSPGALLAAKLITLLLFALVYALAINAAVLAGGAVLGQADHVWSRLLLGLWIAALVTAAVLPVVVLESLSRKGYLFSVLLSCAYAVVSFASVLAISNVILPLTAVFRWALPHMTARSATGFGLDDWFFSAPACAGVLVLTAAVSLALAAVLQGRRER